MRLFVTCIVAACSVLVLSACVDPFEEKGICSYLGTCEMGGGTYHNLNYCKDLGSCDDGKDHTEYTISGKPSKSDASGSESSAGAGGGGDSSE